MESPVNEEQTKKIKRRSRVQTGAPWSKEGTAHLIDTFEKHRLLWDVSLKDYRDAHKRDTFLCDIAAEMERDPHDIKIKWQNLKCQYNAEIRKMKRRSDQSPNKCFVSRWEFFAPMRFLSENDKIKNPTISNLFRNTEKIENPLSTNYTNQQTKNQQRQIDETESENDVPLQNEEEFPNTDIIKLEPEIILDPLCTSNTSQQSKNQKRRFDDVQPENEIQVHNDEAVLNKMFRLLDKPNDDYQIFGDYVATEFRLLKSEKNKMLLRQKIQRAILEVSEMETLEDSGSSWDGTGC